MSSSLNKVMIIGHLGNDPDVRYMPSGDAVASITVATSESWKDKTTGEKKEQTEWHRISFFGKLAEIAGEYLRKGSHVYIEGSLRTRKYTDKDGVEKYATDIKADTMKMLGKANGGGNYQDQGDQNYDNQQQGRHQQQAPQQRQQQQGQQRQQQQQSQQGQQRQPPPMNQRQAGARPAPNFSDMDDDIPFIQSLNDMNCAMGSSKAMLRAKFGRRNSLAAINQGDF